MDLKPLSSLVFEKILSFFFNGSHAEQNTVKSMFFLYKLLFERHKRHRSKVEAKISSRSNITWVHKNEKKKTLTFSFPITNFANFTLRSILGRVKDSNPCKHTHAFTFMCFHKHKILLLKNSHVTSSRNKKHWRFCYDLNKNW